MSGKAAMVMQLELDRWSANLATDVAKLEELLSDDLEFVHPTSSTDTKKSFIANLQVRNPYLSYNAARREIKMLGEEGAVIMSEIHSMARRDPPVNSALVKTRSISVWGVVGGKWQMVRYQATFIP